MEILKNKLPPTIYSRITDADIDSIKTILTADERTLQQLTKLSHNEIKLVIETAAEICVKNKFQTALQVPAWQRFTTGCSTIDSVINGGIPLNGITEIVGPSGVGKTQLCLQLSLTAQFPLSLSGLNKGAVYICTEDVFPSKRLNQLAKVFLLRFSQLHPIKFEDNIFLDHVTDFEQLRRCLYVRLPKLLQHNNIGLIVIDSIAGIFRSEVIDVNYVSRSQEFATITSQLNKLGKEFQAAVVCVNQVTDNILTRQTEPCLGLAWSNLINCRFYLNRSNNVRTFKVLFAPDLKNSTCTFAVNDVGVADVANAC